jgi:hypothetical protein
MRFATVIHWKTNNAPGVRCFSERAYAEERVLSDGNNLADLRQVDDTFVYWPPERGAFPDAATLAQWGTEYGERPVVRSLDERVAALEVKEATRL